MRCASIGAVLAAKATRIPSPSNGLKQLDSEPTLLETIPTKILYFNPDPFYDKCFDMMLHLGHAVVTAISARETLALLRRQIFDALVVDCERDAVDILSFTARVQRLQPSLPVFVAAEWAADLANALEELAHGLAMFAEHESARPATENRMA